VGFYAAAGAHSAFRSPVDHGVGIEVGGSRSSVLSGRTQIFAHPTQILHPPLPNTRKSGCAAADAEHDMFSLGGGAIAPMTTHRGAVQMAA